MLVKARRIGKIRNRVEVFGKGGTACNKDVGSKQLKQGGCFLVIDVNNDQPLNWFLLSKLAIKTIILRDMTNPSKI